MYIFIKDYSTLAFSKEVTHIKISLQGRLGTNITCYWKTFLSQKNTCFDSLISGCFYEELRNFFKSRFNGDYYFQNSSVSWMDPYVSRVWPSLELVVWNNKHYEKPNRDTIYKANIKVMWNISMYKAQMVTECQNLNWFFSVDHA